MQYSITVQYYICRLCTTAKATKARQYVPPLFLAVLYSCLPWRCRASVTEKGTKALPTNPRAQGNQDHVKKVNTVYLDTVIGD